MIIQSAHQTFFMEIQVYEKKKKITKKAVARGLITVNDIGIACIQKNPI